MYSFHFEPHAVYTCFASHFTRFQRNFSCWSGENATIWDVLWTYSFTLYLQKIHLVYYGLRQSLNEPADEQEKKNVGGGGATKWCESNPDRRLIRLSVSSILNVSHLSQHIPYIHTIASHAYSEHRLIDSCRIVRGQHKYINTRNSYGRFAHRNRK